MTSPHANNRPVIQKKLETDIGLLTVEGPVSTQLLREMEINSGLDAFRPASRQKEALEEIAALADGWVIAAHHQGVLVGYVTFHPAEEFERWGRANIREILELGAIEVAPGFRHFGLGKALMGVAFADVVMENFIVLSTEYYWHWDLEGTGLNIWEYQQVMTKLMQSVGMVRRDTDDQEITAHPANMLMVRVGKNVAAKPIESFEGLLFVKSKRS
jgi:acetoin utilization protein AcuA